MKRARLLCQLVVPMARTGAWAPMAATAGLGILAFAISVDEPRLPQGVTIARLRFAVLVAALGAGFLLEDPAETWLAATPTPLAVRRLVRIGLVVPPLIVWWLVLARWASSLFDDVPRQALTLELAAMVGVSLGAAAFPDRGLPAARRGVLGAGAVLVLAATALIAPVTLTLFLPTPDHPGWDASHLRWAAVGALAITTVALTSRDPARRRRGARSD